MTSSLPVVLLHGLWLKPGSMAVLARRLREQGFTAETAGYSSHEGPLEAAGRLTEWIDHRFQGPVHLVGHSLGGVLAVHLRQHHPQLVSRVVCLGSPLLGSRASAAIARFPGGSWLLGGSQRPLKGPSEHGVARAPEGSEIAVIAGCRPVGLGALIARLPAPHDGTVAVEETRLEGLRAHRVIRAAHTELPFSPLAAQLAGAFLRSGTLE